MDVRSPGRVEYVLYRQCSLQASVFLVPFIPDDASQPAAVVVADIDIRVARARFTTVNSALARRRHAELCSGCKTQLLVWNARSTASGENVRLMPRTSQGCSVCGGREHLHENSPHLRARGARQMTLEMLKQSTDRDVSHKLGEMARCGMASSAPAPRAWCGFCSCTMFELDLRWTRR